MYEELKSRLRDPNGYYDEEAADAIEQLQRQLAERDAEIAKYRDAPAVGYMLNTGHGKQLRETKPQCDMPQFWKPLIVKPGEQ